MYKNLKKLLKIIIRTLVRCELYELYEVIPRLRVGIAEVARTMAMLLVLKPAAIYLPRKWALALAERIGLLADILPLGNRFTRTLMKQAFHLSDECAIRNARKWLARPFCDYVILERILRGREDLTKWRIAQSNAETVQQLHASGTPFIVATAHFPRQAVVAFYMPWITPGRILAVTQPLPPKSLHPYALRIRTQKGHILDCFRHVRQGELEFFFVGQGTFYDLVNHLHQRGTVVHAAVDVWWSRKRHSYKRPFAGHKLFSFSTGMATLSRLAQCPIVTYVPFIDDDGTLVLEWGSVIPPPSPADVKADIRITDEILRRMELAIGLRPTQYVLSIGQGRLWNAHTCRWDDQESASFAAVPARCNSEADFKVVRQHPV